MKGLRVVVGQPKPSESRIMIVTRNKNLFEVKRSKCWHYYMRLTLNGQPVTAWVRVTKLFIDKHFKPLDESIPTKLTATEIEYCEHDMTTLLRMDVLEVNKLWKQGLITDQQYNDYQDIIME